MRISEVPTTLSPDGRSRRPHLRTWRDGWRHLRFLMLFSPRTENNTYAMLGPAIAVFLAGVYLIEHRRREGIMLSCMAGAIQVGR